jgi:hypothetical protein
MSDPPKKPAVRGIGWARTNRAAMAADDKRWSDDRFGAANKGRSVTSWHCNCGWSGGAKELKPAESGVACPACGGAPEPVL